jgi:SAM-dependent methyltransferase
MSGQTDSNLLTPPPPPASGARLWEKLFQHAEKALGAGKLDEAATLYQQLLQANMAPGLMLYRLGMIANSRKDYHAAWDLHCRAIAADPALAARITPRRFVHHNHVCRPSYDTEEGPHCPVCQGGKQEPMMVVSYLSWSVYHPAFHPVRRWVRCLDCGHGFANPRPSAAALREAFQDPAPAHLLKWQYNRLVAYAEIVRSLAQRCSGRDFLDVGVANGGLAGVAMDFGFRAWGLDVHPAYADTVRRLGVEFLLGDMATYDFGEQRFDVIALGDVIEHVPDPHAVLARVTGILRPGGLIWLSTPNYEGVWTRALWDKDPMWKEGEHLHYFCLRSLVRLLNDHGLRIVDSRLSNRYVGCTEVTIERAV